MAKNKDLNKAKEQKNDEFYTQLSDIENEMRHYREHFKGKTIFCNCDDPYESNFFKYFAMNFNFLGLKKLIATCYATSPVMYTQLTLWGDKKPCGIKHEGRKPYKIEITEVIDENGDGAIDLADVAYLIQNRKNVLTELKGDGDFRSNECVELLKSADIVVTNPPFSLFREFVAQLIQYNKQFIIIGNQNAIHYKEIFPLIRDNKMWLGYGFTGNVGFFINKKYVDYAKSSQHKEGMIRVSGVMWFTNIDTDKRHENMILFKHYSPDYYPKYENYDGIDVKKVEEIPDDYYGNMGVPDTFLTKYNPDQFQIIGIGSGELAKSIGVQKNYRGRTDIAYVIDGKSKCPYSRIIIRRRTNNTAKDAET